MLPTAVRVRLDGPRRFDEIQHELAAIRSMVEEQRRVLLSLNHNILYGGETGLPLLVDVVDRVRSDAETTVGAVHAMHRAMSVTSARLEAAVDRLNG